MPTIAAPAATALKAAHEAGAQVTLVAGPVALATPRGVGRVNVKSALNMQKSLELLVSNATVFISAAAVADWRPAHSADQKSAILSPVRGKCRKQLYRLCQPAKFAVRPRARSGQPPRHRRGV